MFYICRESRHSLSFTAFRRQSGTKVCISGLPCKKRKKKHKVLPQILQPQKHVGAESLQVVAVQIQAPEAGQAGEGPLLQVRDAVVAQVKQVQAGEIPKVCPVDPLDEVSTEVQLASVERPGHELGHVEEAALFAVDGQAEVRDVQVARAANGTDDGDRGSRLVARHGGILVGTAESRGYSCGPRPFGGPGVLLPVSTLS